ncbi:hypothetical protein [Polaromonas glacialis]|uniref:hypothetical protein n=1 Tax=Polaromonas glacialis TaxID=866564 RepID=UPI0012EC08E6|nr:hypothetical protein [Polaromonas glacialis]
MFRDKSTPFAISLYSIREGMEELPGGNQVVLNSNDFLHKVTATLRLASNKLAAAH